MVRVSTVTDKVAGRWVISTAQSGSTDSDGAEACGGVFSAGPGGGVAGFVLATPAGGRAPPVMGGTTTLDMVWVGTFTAEEAGDWVFSCGPTGASTSDMI